MDQANFDAFYERTYHRVVGQIYLTCGNLAEAQDCAQEAFIRAWDKRSQLRDDRSPEAWVRTVAHRLSISRWRKQRRDVPAGDALPDSGRNDPDAADRIALHRALQQLPDETRRTLVLHYFHDLPITDIAAETGAPVGTVKARLSRGRTTLAGLLGDSGQAAATAALQDSAGGDPFGIRRAGDSVRGVVTPPAAEIRRRGAVGHRRRVVAVIATAAAGAVVTTGVAFGATGLVQVAPWLPQTTVSQSRAEPQPGGTPSVINELTWDKVPTTEDIWWNEQGDLRTETASDDESGWPVQWSPSACIGDTAGLRAQTVLVRAFSGGPELEVVQYAIVMEFASEAEAAAALRSINGWYVACDGKPAANGKGIIRTSTGTELNVPGATAAVFASANWRSADNEDDTEFEDASLVQVGNRVAWTIASLTGQDNNCGPLPGTDAPQCRVAAEAAAVAQRIG